MRYAFIVPRKKPNVELISILTHMKQYVYLFLGMTLFIFGISSLVSRSFVEEGEKQILDAQLTDITTDNTQKLDTMESSTATERPVIIMKTSKGDITIELFEDLSPVTTGNILDFARDGLYEGTVFHRVIEDFMIQGGDPLSKDDANRARFGTGGPGFEFEDEFNDQPLVEGSFAMANSGPNTNGSQFFIVTAEETPWLDGAHTNVGRVIGGMDIVGEIGTAPTDARDLPLEDIRIESVEIVRE